MVDKSQFGSTHEVGDWSRGAADDAARSAEIHVGTAAVAAKTCAACGLPKKPGFAFCRTCHAALTIAERAQVAKGPDDAEFAESYLAIVTHLQAHPARRQIVGSGGGGAGDGWAFTSPIELATAGYEFLNDGHCGAPRCSREIWWFRTPQGGRIAVNAGHRERPKPFDWQPHRVSCADPGYWDRVKLRQEEKHKARVEARRNRRAAKRGLQTAAKGAR